MKHIVPVIFGIAIAVLAIFAEPRFVGRLSRWADARVAVQIPDGTWRAVYQDSPINCPDSASQIAGCPANPSNPALWESPLGRFDPAHRERVFSRLEHEIWIGVTVPTDL